MHAQRRIESLLVELSASLSDSSTPPKLTQSIEYALFPGGARIRPRLAIAVSEAYKPNDAGVIAAANASAAAIEMMHCASLIQDDLKCFDNSAVRRGKPSLHKQWGADYAILTADALIVGCFQLLTSPSIDNATSTALIRKLARHTGSCGGITAGQAWESEPGINLEAYHASKTGSLFAAATELGAISAGACPDDWSQLGHLIGSAYQVADDIHDTIGNSNDLGKPTGQDAQLQRPNVVLELGLDEAVVKLKKLVEDMVASVPDCAHREQFEKILREEANQFIPKEVDRHAA